MLFAIVSWTAVATWLFDLGWKGTLVACMIAMFLSLGLKGQLPGDTKGPKPQFGKMPES